MENIVSETGFWISNKDEEHLFIPELSKEINYYIVKNNIKTVYDFGCGRGEYLQKIKEMDDKIEATGFEGEQTNGIYSNILKADLSKDLNLSPVDLVISIEVGEHIPKQFEQTFINNITNSSTKHAILSWAVEGQYGLGHVNCQNNSYVIAEMNKRGWVFNEAEALKMRHNMPDIWIKNTLMVFYIDKSVDSGV
jgi:predicted TPR repeat methyltransferase